MKPLSVATRRNCSADVSTGTHVVGSWTARGIGAIEPHSTRCQHHPIRDGCRRCADRCSRYRWRLDPAKLLRRLRVEGTRRGTCAIFAARNLPNCWKPSGGRWTIKQIPSSGRRRAPVDAWMLGTERGGRLRADAALLGFVGESAVALAGNVAHPARLRWRPILYNIRSAGFDATAHRRVAVVSARDRGRLSGRRQLRQ